jgi:hypothetical protein
MPPPDVVMILLPLKEMIDAAPNDPAALPRVRRAPRLRGVGEHGQTELVGDREQFGVVDGLAEQVDRHEGLDARPRVAQLGESLAEQLRVHVARRELAVDEVGHSARVDDGVRGGGERHRRRDHDVARPRTEAEQSQVQRSRA